MARPPVYLSEEHDLRELVGSAEVAALLGISPSRVKQIRHADDFPPPAFRLSMGEAWYREDVEAWWAENADRRRRHSSTKEHA